MVSDLSVIWISISVIVLCWAVVRINQKIDETIRNYKYGNTLDHVIKSLVNCIYAHPFASVHERFKVTAVEAVIDAPELMLSEPDGAVISTSI